MELYEQDGDLFTYEYLQDEFDEWTKDVQEAKKAGNYIHSYKLYGCSLYYLITRE
jgi:hypothetical protein